MSLMFIILMGDYTWRQYSIDSWHKNADRINLTGSGEDFFMWPQAAQEIKEMCPEIEQTCCVMSQNGRIKYGQREVDVLRILPPNLVEAYEIKSAQTWNADFFANLNYLRPLLKERLLKTTVVYDGTQESHQTDNGIINFRHLQW